MSDTLESSPEPIWYLDIEKYKTRSSICGLVTDKLLQCIDECPKHNKNSTKKEVELKISQCPLDSKNNFFVSLHKARIEETQGAVPLKTTCGRGEFRRILSCWGRYNLGFHSTALCRKAQRDHGRMILDQNLINFSKFHFRSQYTGGRSMRMVPTRDLNLLFPETQLDRNRVRVSH